MRFIQCDVCETNLDPREIEVAVLELPGSWMGHPDSQGVTADICSWECLATITPPQELAERMLPTREQAVVPSEPEEEDEEEEFTEPQMPVYRHRPITPEESEAATGVRRKR